MADQTGEKFSFSEAIRANPRGWVVVAFIWIALSVVFSARSALGLMMPEWEKELGWARTFVSTGGSIVLVIMAVVSPVAGNLLDRIGPRLVVTTALAAVGAAILATSAMSTQWQFIVLFCIVGGVGFGSLAVPQAAATIACVFDRDRGLATGISTSGASGGQLLVIPLLALIVAAIGWRSGFVLFGAAILALAPIAWFLIPKGISISGSGGVSDGLGARLSILRRSGTFWLLFWGFVICGFTTTGVIEVHLIPYATACGYPQLTSATAYGVLSAFNMGGMILAGWLADRMHRPLLLGAIYFFRGLSFLILMQITGNIELLFIFAVMFGVFDYSTMPVLANIVATHIGVRIMGLTLGLLFAGHSAGAAAGSFMGGYFFDLFNSYDWIWLISIGLALIAAVLSWMIKETRGTDHVPAAQAA